MTEVAFILFSAAADGNNFDGRRMQLCAGTKTFLSFAEAFCFAVVFVVGEKHIGHAVVLIGMKKIISCGDLSSSPQGFSGARFGPLCQLQPAFFPALFISRLDVPAEARDIEQIAAALLRLRHESQCLAAKRFGGK